MTEELVVPAVLEGERVDRAVALLTGWTRSEVQSLIEDGKVVVDGRTIAKSRRLAAGEVVELRGEPEAPGVAAPDAGIELVIRYEDDDVVVVAKPAGLVVHPGAGHADGTMVNGLLARYPEIGAVGEAGRPGIVHRLDRDTSGLLVVARSSRAYEVLVAMLAAHEVERRYLALVWGTLDTPRGVVDAPIGRSVRRPTRMAVREGGRGARTRYEVRVQYRDPAVSLLECRLETGRTHQIRVHLQAIGHPVVGDAAYGGVRAALPMGRPFLHAARLAFDHPITHRRVEVDEELTPDLTVVLARLDEPDEGEI
ncbi:MAG TPA: RluA family pseudouridine synthase [Acidimicrobiia bacterium]